MKANRHHAQIIEHIKTVVGVDLSACAEPLRLRMLNVDVSALDPNKVTAIHRIANQYKKISVEPGGCKKLAIALI